MRPACLAFEACQPLTSRVVTAATLALLRVTAGGVFAADVLNPQWDALGTMASHYVNGRAGAVIPLSLVTLGLAAGWLALRVQATARCLRPGPARHSCLRNRPRAPRGLSRRAAGPGRQEIRWAMAGWPRLVTLGSGPEGEQTRPMNGRG
jgi:hypothetical protein